MCLAYNCLYYYSCDLYSILTFIIICWVWGLLDSSNPSDTAWSYFSEKLICSVCSLKPWHMIWILNFNRIRILRLPCSIDKSNHNASIIWGSWMVGGRRYILLYLELVILATQIFWYMICSPNSWHPQFCFIMCV